MMTSRGKQSEATAPFIAELLSILSEGPSELVDWTPNGQAFVIWDSDRFADEVLERRSKSSNFASFVRQLNFYGFRKINKTTKGHDPRVWEFQHIHFVRDRPDLLSQIRRRTAHDNNNKNDVEVLRNELDAVRMSNSALREAVVLLYHELETAVGRPAMSKLDLSPAVLEVLQQQQRGNTKVGRRSRKIEVTNVRSSRSFTSVATESGRKRARTESAVDASCDDIDIKHEDPLAISCVGEPINEESEEDADAEEDTEHLTDAEPAVKGAFEFGDMVDAMLDDPTPNIHASPTRHFPPPLRSAQPTEAFSIGFSQASPMASWSVPPKPILTRLPSYSGLVSVNLPASTTPMFASYAEEPGLASSPHKAEDFFAADEAPSAALRSTWDPELESPSIARIPSWSSMHGHSRSLRSFHYQETTPIPASSASVPQMHTLTDAQKAEIVQSLAKALFSGSAGGGLGVNLRQVASAPAVQQALRANAVSVDETDPSACLRLFFNAVRPDVVLACLYPLIPQFQQLITMMASSFATQLARSGSASAPFALSP